MGSRKMVLGSVLQTQALGTGRGSLARRRKWLRGGDRGVIVGNWPARPGK